MKSNVQQIHQIKEYLTSIAKAVSGDDAVKIDFNANQEDNFFLWDEGLVEQGRIIAPEVEGSLIKKSRAAIDLASCYLMFHNPETHHAKTFDNPEEQHLFTFFEKVRVIAAVKDSYQGVAKNILEKIEKDILYQQDSYENLPLILLDTVFPSHIGPHTQLCVQNLKQILDPNLVNKINNLRTIADQQDQYANAVEDILSYLRQLQDTQESEEESQNNPGNTQQSSNQDTSVNQENIEQEPQDNPSSGKEEIKEKPPKKDQTITDFKEDEQGGPSKVKSEKTVSADDHIEFKSAYKIFTSKFDEVVFPQKLVSKNELELLRDQLDLKMMKLNSISKRMSLKLKRKLMAKNNSYIERDNSSGVLDKKKFTQLVIDPAIEDMWINNKKNEYQDTALTILLDNSGSMRGNPIVMSALACEIIADILEKFSIKTEIIGFTTADWKGGRARKMWEGLGSPANPGRLNELRHIIYKSANQSFKRQKVNLGLMLKEGILKENIDGEALLFAKARLMQGDENRKILMVISDGTPIDDSTNCANDDDILNDHLHHVINKMEKQSKIEVVGIGIGHYTGDFYNNAMTIKTLEDLGDVMIEKLVKLL